MENLRRKALVLITAVIVVTSVTSIAFYSNNMSVFELNTQAQQLEPLSESKTIGSHIPGYPAVLTNAEVLDPIITQTDLKNAVIDPSQYLRDFNYGRVSIDSNGTTNREFTLIASDSEMKEVSPGVFYNVWTFNGTVPGPTIRATEGDIIKINFINNGSKPHSIHTHGIHPAGVDGVFEMIGPNGQFTYEFMAEPFGVFPYHCHMTPLEEHISHGLYGVMIIDPKTPRPPADEIVMVMNGYDTDFDTENNFYTVNGIPYYYMHHPIQLNKDELVRIYVVNMLEFDPLNNLHIHANLFEYFPSGTSMIPSETNDIVTLSQGDRGIMELKYKYPGKYMFHAHKTEFSEKGWMGVFFVNEGTNSTSNIGYDSQQSGTTFNNSTSENKITDEVNNNLINNKTTASNNAGNNVAVKLDSNNNYNKKIRSIVDTGYLNNVIHTGGGL